MEQRLDGVRRERRRLDAAQMAVVHEGAHFAVVRAGRADRADDERGLRVHEGHEQRTRELVELVDVVDHDDPAPPLLHLLERGAGAVEEERAVELALGPARASHLAGKKVGERGKGKTLGLGVPGDASDGQSGLGGEPQALVREPGLAQARAAADEDAARTRVTERRGDRLDLVGSAEERPRRRVRDLAQRDGEDVDHGLRSPGSRRPARSGGGRRRRHRGRRAERPRPRPAATASSSSATGRDEAVAAPVDRAHDRLTLAVVTDRATRGLDAGRERGLADEPVAPDVVEELFFGDHPLAVDDEVGEDVEHLRFDRDRNPAPAQLEERRVELDVTEAVDHGRGPRASRDGRRPRSRAGIEVSQVSRSW